MNKIEIIVNPGGRSIRLESDRTLLAGLSAHGFFRHLSLCAGIGRCANCRLKFVSPPPPATQKEHEVLEPGEIDAAWRLACEHLPRNGQEISIPVKTPRLNFTRLSGEKPLFLAVDIGTTTVKWGFEHGRGRLSFGSAPNPQAGTGGEVMSRMQFALESPDNARVQQEAIQELIQDILDLVEVPPSRLLLTGNPAMICLALGFDCTGIARSPYKLPLSGDDWYEMGPGLPRAYVPALISPFIGADITCGLYNTSFFPEKFPCLFADFGTNAEMVLLAGKGQCFGTSVAMGPALEGCGLRFGAAAGEKDACSEIVLDQNGIKPRGGEKCARLTASAYLDLIRRLKGLGLVQCSGHFSAASGSPLADRVRKQIKNGRLYLTEKIYLDSADIEELLKVKAAFSLGLEALLKNAGISPGELKRIFVAGALGERLSPGVLTGLGFLPSSSEGEIVFCGNTALAGGLQMARNLKDSRNRVQNIRDSVQSIDLARSETYSGNRFVRHMRFEFI